MTLRNTQSVILGLSQYTKAFLALSMVAIANMSHASESVDADKLSLKPLDVFQECDVCPEMVVLPMGSFTMGAPLEESAEMMKLFLKTFNRKQEPGVPLGIQNEGPQHEVKFDISLAMGRNEITRAEWMACVSDGGCTYTPDPEISVNLRNVDMDDPRHPVMDVSYIDALEYVIWLNGKAGHRSYRLPTEAEWKYAARAGTQTRFAQGDMITTDQVNYTPWDWNGDVFTPDPRHVAKLVRVDDLDAANAWGLRHMSGNVFEFTQSCMKERHLALSSATSYLQASEEVQSCERVIKGGSYNGFEGYSRLAKRGGRRETWRSYMAGFRVVLELESR